MVEDDAQLAVVANELRGDAELAGRDQQVERAPVPGEGVQAVPCGRVVEDTERTLLLGLHPHPHEGRPRRERGQCRATVDRSQVDPADDPAHERVRLGHVQKIARFGQCRRRLDHHHAVDAEGQRQRLQVGRHEVVLHAGDALDDA